jgi:hypothetical protein
MDKLRNFPTVEIDCSPARYLISIYVSVRFLVGCVVWRLTLNEDCTVGKPYDSCDGYDNLVSVPNGQAGGFHESICEEAIVTNRSVRRTCEVGSRAKRQQGTCMRRPNRKELSLVLR